MKSRTLSVFGLIVTVLVVPGNAGALPAAPQTAAQATVTPQNLRAERADDPAAAPARREGDGPFTRLIIRGATLIDGTGGPPRGPVDIVIEGNKIVDIAGAGTPGLPMNDSTRRPRGAVREIQAAGMYVIPGLVDLHVHQGTKQKAPDSEYYNKLWLAHGITAVRGVPFASFDYSMKEKARSAKRDHRATVHRLPAPRQRLGEGSGAHSGAGTRMGALARPKWRRWTQGWCRAPRHHGRAAR